MGSYIGCKIMKQSSLQVQKRMETYTQVVVTFTFGKDASFWGRKVASTLLKVRRKGHGDKVKQKMIFPKLVYILRKDGANDDIFKEAIQTSAVALYPDYIRDDMPSPMGQI